MDSSLNFESIQRSDLHYLVGQIENRLWTPERKSQFLNFIDQVIRYDRGEQGVSNPNLSSRNIIQALELLKAEDPQIKFEYMIADLNSTFKAKFPNYMSANDVKTLADQYIEDLATRYKIPAGIIPEILVVLPMKNTDDLVDDHVDTPIAGSYSVEENLIRLYTDALQSEDQILSTLGHEFKHFINFLEIQKMKLQDPILFTETVYQFLGEYDRGLDMALTSFGERISADELFDHMQFIGPARDPFSKLARNARLVRQETFALVRQELGGQNIDTTIEIDEFLECNLSKITEALEGIDDSYDTDMLRLLVEIELLGFNQASLRDKYAYLRELDLNKRDRAMKLLKGGLQAKFDRKNLAHPSYKQDMYELNEEEALTRTTEHAFNLRRLLDSDASLKQALQSRPDKTKPVDMQPQDWIDQLSKTVSGERAISCAMMVRANSLLVRLSRSLRAQEPMKDDLVGLIKELEQIDEAVSHVVSNAPDVKPEFAKALKGVMQREPHTAPDPESTNDYLSLSQVHRGLIDALQSMKNVSWSSGFQIYHAIKVAKRPSRIIFSEDLTQSSVRADHNMPLVQYIVFRARENVVKSGEDLNDIDVSIKKGNYRSAFIAAWNQGQRAEQMRAYINEWQRERV